MSFFQRWIQPAFLVSTFAVVFGVLPTHADDWQPITRYYSLTRPTI